MRGDVEMGNKSKKKNSEDFLQNKKKRGIKPGEVRNPEGKGGFKDHPDHINPGGRPKNQESYSYWLNYFKTLSIEEFQAYKKNNPNMSMAALGAYARLMKSVEKLEEFKEVANRTEGVPKQQIELSSDKNKPLIFNINLRQTEDRNKDG